MVMPLFLVTVLGALLLSVTPLLAQGYVKGRIYQRQDNGVVPVSHARVEARSAQTGNTLAEVTSDDYGAYVLSGLPAGEVIVKVSHPQYHAANRGHHEKGARLQRPAQGSCGTLDFEMARNGELEVRVVDAIGQRVDDVTITVTSADEPGKPIKPPGFRDARRVLYVSVPPGRYRVYAEPSKRLRGIEYEPAVTEVDFEHGRRSKAIDIVVPSGRRYRVSGRVTGLNTADAERMMITLTLVPADGQANQQPARFGAPLNRSGYFALNRLPAGSYVVELTQFLDASRVAGARRDYVLRTIQVSDDLRGLLLAAPAGAN
jgi:hypothetical protein